MIVDTFIELGSQFHRKFDLKLRLVNTSNINQDAGTGTDGLCT